MDNGTAMIDYEALGERLKTARLEAGVEQTALAEAAGVHVQTVFNLERGLLINVRLEVLARLAAALGCPLAAWLALAPAAARLIARPRRGAPRRTRQ